MISDAGSTPAESTKDGYLVSIVRVLPMCSDRDNWSVAIFCGLVQVSTGSADYSFVPGLMLTATRIKQKTAKNTDSAKNTKVLAFPARPAVALQMAA
jgi:hypothetical protein